MGVRVYGGKKVVFGKEKKKKVDLISHFALICDVFVFLLPVSCFSENLIFIFGVR